MTSARGDLAVGRLLCCLILLFSSLPAGSAANETPAGLDIPPPAGEWEAWLITVGPGSAYWERFGHNAIWLREPARGLDHTFNFGYFDFRQEDFFLRFLTGRMLYQSLAFAADQELAGYAQAGRSIRAQRLNLSDTEYGRLRDHLLWHIQPANRDYLYDYYLDNCSTRIRDAIDLAVAGALSDLTAAEPAVAGFRAHTRRLTQMTWWYYLGLETVLGRPVDRPISRWDEMFLPGVLAETVAWPEVQGELGSLAGTDRRIYPSAQPGPAGRPGSIWWRYLAVSLALSMAAWAVGRRRRVLRLRLARAWLGLAAAMGVILLLLWAFTDHKVVGPNANLLLLNPLFLLLLGRKGSVLLPWLVALCGLLALAQWMLSGWQYDLDVIAFVLPFNVIAAGALYGAFRVERASA